MFRVTAYHPIWMFKTILPVAKSCFFKWETLLYTSISIITFPFAMLLTRADFRSEAPPSKYMRLGSGISNIAKSPIVSCFDVELFAEEDLSDQDGMSESDLVALFGCHSHAQCNV
jgi:hypothetical protein